MRGFGSGCRRTVTIGFVEAVPSFVLEIRFQEVDHRWRSKRAQYGRRYQKLSVAKMSDRAFMLASAREFIGQEIAVSDWFEVTQSLIDEFADLTDDHQWIHQEGPAALAGPFGGPIAHGLLLLSLTTRLARDSGVFPTDARSCVIYGYEKIRFQTAVRTGKRVRCRTTILKVEGLGARVVLTVRFKVEGEGETLPALVADCILVAMP